jgi:hypothetical protein
MRQNEADKRIAHMAAVVKRLTKNLRRTANLCYLSVDGLFGLNIDTKHHRLSEF